MRSTFLLAGLLALKSDATASFFRPALGTGFGVAVAAAAALAVGSEGFALKSMSIDFD